MKQNVFIIEKETLLAWIKNRQTEIWNYPQTSETKNILKEYKAFKNVIQGFNDINKSLLLDLIYEKLEKLSNPEHVLTFMEFFDLSKKIQTGNLG